MKSSQVRSFKSLLRRQLRSVLSALNRSQIRRKSVKVVNLLLKSSDFKKAKNIFTYMALKNEVQTKGLITKALKLGKHIFAPRINPHTKEITIYEIRRPAADLRAGSFGIYEPRARKDRKGKASELDLILVPGLGFDRRGRRLGRGEGYFDRFLKKTGKAKKIGLAFREQIVKRIPSERHDVRVDKVLIG
jgi:5-formyltetrahydrofolate cyclo-ligase